MVRHVRTARDFAWEDDGTSQWEVRVQEALAVKGFVSRVVQGFAPAPQPKNLQLVVIDPLKNFGANKMAIDRMKRSMARALSKIGKTGNSELSGK